MEEHEFDIGWNAAKGTYSATLNNGVYLINIKAKGYKEINKVFAVGRDTNTADLQFELVKAKQNAESFQVQV